VRWGPAIVLAFAAAGVLAGCGELNPYETVPEKPPPGDPKTRVGICYDGLASSRQEVEAAAQTACGPGTYPEREGTDYELESCGLLLPARATFICRPKK
jgi:hypothetical protein